MTIKQKLTDWYNRNIQAGWYASASLIGGWVSAGVAWLPDFVNYMLQNHLDFVAGKLLPTMDPETKAVVLGLYLAFGAPVLRAKIQKWMQKKSIKQQAEAGKVMPLPASNVAVPAAQLEAAQAAATAMAIEPEPFEIERQRVDPGSSA